MSMENEQHYLTLLEAQLESGERLLWSDRPVLRPVFSLSTLTQAAMGVPALGMVVFAMHHFGIELTFDSNDSEAVIQTFLFTPFLLFPAVFFSIPWLVGRRLTRAIYAVTDRRALALRLHGRRSRPQVDVYPYEMMTEVEVIDHSAEVGSVFFKMNVPLKTSDTMEAPDGFQHLRHPQVAADCLKTRIGIAKVTSSNGGIEPTAIDANRTSFAATPPYLVSGTFSGKHEGRGRMADDYRDVLSVPYSLAGAFILVLFTATGLPGFLCGFSSIYLVLKLCGHLRGGQHRTKATRVSLLATGAVWLTSVLWLALRLYGYEISFPEGISNRLAPFRVAFSAADPALYLFLIFPLAGLSLIIIARNIKHGMVHKEESHTGITTGTVVGWKTNSAGGDDSGYTYIPVVEYEVEGCIYQVDGTSGMDEKRRLPRGSKVKISYLPANPCSAFLADENWRGMYWSMILFGILAVMIGMALLLLHGREIIEQLLQLLSEA